MVRKVHNFKHGPASAAHAMPHWVSGEKKVPYKLDCRPDKYNINDTVHYVHPSGKAQFNAQLSFTQWAFGWCRPTPPPVPKAGAGIDMRPLCNEVRDQGSEGSCTGFSGAAFRELLKAVHNGSDKPTGIYLSPADLYYKERALIFMQSMDNGASLGEGVQVLETYGICPEADMPYVAGEYTKSPSATADIQAAAYRIGQPYRVDPSDIAGMKALLYAKQPIWLSFSCFQSFEDVHSNGLAPVPNPSKEKLIGGHAVLIVGFDDAAGHFIVRNSWGNGFGERGYCYMPYGYNQFFTDTWTADPC